MDLGHARTNPACNTEQPGQTPRGLRIAPTYDAATARGEKRLMIAVLRDAISEFRRFQAASNRRGRRLFADVQRWFTTNDDAWPFAFVSICETLGVDSERLRGVLVNGAAPESRTVPDVQDGPTATGRKPVVRRCPTALVVVCAMVAGTAVGREAEGATTREACVAACGAEIHACMSTCGSFGSEASFVRTCRRAVVARCRRRGVETCAGTPSPSATTTTTIPDVTSRIESFDDATSWQRRGNSTSDVYSDTQDKQEGSASLVWRSTINEQITKRFASPIDLGTASEIRVWIRANRTVGSACCGFSMRLLSSQGYFERHILPDIRSGGWVEDVSERDAWFASFGEPQWNDIRGLEFVFYGDSTETLIQFDDLRAALDSSTTPDARRTAGRVVQENGGPLDPPQRWVNVAGAANAETDTPASVQLERGVEFGFVGSTYLDATNFGFSIPAGAVIRGVRVEVRVREESWLVWDWEVRLRRSGVRSGADRAFGDAFPDGFAYRYYGGPTDLWDLALTAGDVNAPGFGVSIAVGTHSPPATALIDDVRIGVYYDVPGSPGGR